MFFKTRIKVVDMSKVLYAFTTDNSFFENSFDSLDNKNIIDRTIIKRELTFLIIITIDYLLRSKKLQKIYREKANQLMLNYLEHFKNETNKTGTSDVFIELLEARGGLFNQFIETDTPSSATHFPFKIAEKIANYCGVENDPFFIMKIIKLWDVNFKTLESMFDKFKLVD